MSPRLHPAEQYARAVLNGRIPACHWVKRACARYFDDKKHARSRGLRFDRVAAQRAIDFFSITPITQGERAGQPFVIENWVLFVVWNLFGWYRAKHPRWKIEKEDGEFEDTSGTRRFRTAYLEVARKNIKTSLGSRIPFYLAFAEGDYGAECYSVAMKRDQAKIPFEEARQIVNLSEEIREYSGIEVLTNNLNQISTMSKFEPLSSEAKSMDGLRIKGALLDEVHAWTKRDIYDKINRATSVWREPLITMITTAGATDESHFCWEQHEYTCKVLDGILEDDTWFGIIYTIDEGDDWQDETVWIKANPYLGLSKKWDYMRTEAQRAAAMPTALNQFLRYDLNVWVRADTKWMPMDDWRLCSGPVPAHQLADVLAGRPCYAGLDLATNTDLAPLVFEFPPIDDDPLHYVIPLFFCPEDAILKRSKMDRVPYDVWADQGYITPTPGNMIDQNFIMRALEEQMTRFKLRRLYFDRWGSTKIITDLQNELGFTVDQTEHERYNRPLLVQFGQGYASMSAPMKDMLRVTMLHQYAHGDHPVLTWNMDNLISLSDPAGNIKPDKSKSRERIDGAVALIMAHAGTMTHTPEQESVYKTRGILTI